MVVGINAVAQKMKKPRLLKRGFVEKRKEREEDFGEPKMPR